MQPSALSIDPPPCGPAPRSTGLNCRSRSRKPSRTVLSPLPGQVLDYGCGRGGDVARLRELGYTATGWDPVFAPDQPLAEADIVNLGYVVNVIESPEERAETLRKAWNLTRSALVVAARLDWEARGVASQPVADGIVTTRGTFQKFYTQYELKSWIESILGCGTHAAAPGVFYVFRNPADAESLRARQVRRPSAAPRQSMSRLLYERHTELLQELASFLEDRGRLPDRLGTQRRRITAIRLRDRPASLPGTMPGNRPQRLVSRSSPRTRQSPRLPRPVRIRRTPPYGNPPTRHTTRYQGPLWLLPRCHGRS